MYRGNPCTKIRRFSGLGPVDPLRRGKNALRRMPDAGRMLVSGGLGAALSAPSVLLKEQARLEKELARSKGMLSNEKFLSKAPEAKVQEEKDKLAGYEQMMEQVKERLTQMSK